MNDSLENTIMTAVDIIAAAIVLVILVNFWQLRNSYANAVNENEISIVQSRNTAKYSAYDEVPLRGNDVIRAITANYYDAPVYVDAGFNSVKPEDSFKADESLTEMFVRPFDTTNPNTLGREYSVGTEANLDFSYWFTMGKSVDGASTTGKTLGDMFDDGDIYMSFVLRGGAEPEVALARARSEVKAWLDADADTAARSTALTLVTRGAAQSVAMRDKIIASLSSFSASADLQDMLGFGDVSGILLIAVVDGDIAVV